MTSALRRDLLSAVGGEPDRRRHVMRLLSEHDRGWPLVGGEVKCQPRLVEALLPGQHEVAAKFSRQSARLT